jgi:hypothetical protein
MGKKLGIINSWNHSRSVGTIICRDTTPPERYFLFASRIISGEEPRLNSLVLFDPDPRPPLPGKIPAALRVEVIESQS